MMDKTPRRALLRDESGQAALVVALFLFFVFLAFAALGIDGAAFYLTRRDLQNAADASALAGCRAFAEGGSSTAALNAALNAVQSNLGSWAEFAGSNPPTTNTGTGANLLRGVEAVDPQVRVALQRPVPTVLTQFLGRDQTIATAQARCDSRAGGGLMPIAIQRYDGEPGGTLRDYLAIPSAPPYPSDSITTTLPGRYGPFDVPIPDTAYTTSEAQPGPEVLLVGQSAETNNGESSMRNLVLLDIRDVASFPPEYYNGADSQADAAKYMSQDWIYMHGYPGPYPQVGSQVAILDGASNAFAAGAVQDAGYRVGDTIAAIVYDGYVWESPDYMVSLTPNPANPNGITAGYPMDAATAVVYTVNIAQAGPRPWFGALNFDLTFDFSNEPLPPDTHVTLNGNELTAPDFAYTASAVTGAGWNGELRIWSTEAITQVRYLSGLNLSADSSLGVTRGASSNFGFGPLGLDYALRSNHGKIIVRQGDSASANVITFGAGPIPGGPGCRNVPLSASILAGGTAQPWATFFSSAQTMSVNLRQNENTLNFALNVRSGAPTGSYTLRFSMGTSSTTCASVPLRTLDIPIEIELPSPTATPNKFVFIQGYAVFRITRVDTNDVWGTAISQLFWRFEDIRVGLRPRLVPWN